MLRLMICREKEKLSFELTCKTQKKITSNNYGRLQKFHQVPQQQKQKNVKMSTSSFSFSVFAVSLHVSIQLLLEICRFSAAGFLNNLVNFEMTFLSLKIVVFVLFVSSFFWFFEIHITSNNCVEWHSSHIAF